MIIKKVKNALPRPQPRRPSHKHDNHHHHHHHHHNNHHQHQHHRHWGETPKTVSPPKKKILQVEGEGARTFTLYLSRKKKKRGEENGARARAPTPRACGRGGRAGVRAGVRFLAPPLRSNHSVFNSPPVIYHKHFVLPCVTSL